MKLLILMLFISIQFANAQVDSYLSAPLLLSPTSEYLGTANNNILDVNSISNEYGLYGNPYSADGINNPYSLNGNVYNVNSVNSTISINNIQLKYTISGREVNFTNIRR